MIDPMVDSFEINQVSWPSKEPKFDPQNLTFTKNEAMHIRCPYDDAFVVTLTLVRLNVHWILVDNESSMNELYKYALDKIKINSSVVKSVNTPLSGFTGSPIMPVGEVILPLSMGASYQSHKDDRVSCGRSFLNLQCKS